MMNKLTMQIVDMVARSLEFVGVAVIGVALVYAVVRAVRHYRLGHPDVYDQPKIFVGRGLQLGLEFLVAADIICTVTVEPTRDQITSLDLLIVIRTFLSWSIIVVEKKGEMQDYMKQVASLMEFYVPPTRAQIQNSFQSSKTSLQTAGSTCISKTIAPARTKKTTDSLLPMLRST